MMEERKGKYDPIGVTQGLKISERSRLDHRFHTPRQ